MKGQFCIVSLNTSKLAQLAVYMTYHSTFGFIAFLLAWNFDRTTIDSGCPRTSRVFSLFWMLVSEENRSYELPTTTCHAIIQHDSLQLMST